MLTGDGGEALAHRGMLPGAKRRDDYPRRGGGDNAEAEGGGVDFCGGLERGPWEIGWPWKVRRYHGGSVKGRLGGSCGTLPPETTGVVSGSEDVGNGVAGEGSEVPDGLHSGIRPSDLLERGCPGPKAQL